MIKTIIKENLYLDSVFSMTAGRELKKLEGIKSATLVMGTDLNKSVLAEIGALTPEAGHIQHIDYCFGDGERGNRGRS